MNDRNEAFAHALIAAERAADIAEEDDIYGWLVGSWQLQVRRYLVDLTEREVKGEAHFARVLNGRAIQDVWIMPSRPASAELLSMVDSFGTTLRVWDAQMRAWRITWINPARGTRDELIGRRVGDRLVQLGRHADGTPIRWTFSDITADSFLWSGEALMPDGEQWKLESQFFATRTK